MMTFDDLSEKEQDMLAGLRTIKSVGAGLQIEFLANVEAAGYPDDFLAALRRYFSAGQCMPH